MAERLVGAGQQFGTITDALVASATGDTITITDSATYTEPLNDIQLNQITLRSSAADPDDFPVLRLYFNPNTLNFIDNWAFKSVIMEPNSDSRFIYNLKNIAFVRCVFRNYDYILQCDCLDGRKKQFWCCLFYDISDYVFNAQQNYNDGALEIKNCTFHNCANIFKNDFYNEVYAASPKFANCIFTACSGIASGVSDVQQYNPSKRHNIYQQIQCSTFSNDPQTVNAQLGGNCIVNINESLIYAYAGAKTLPGHFRITDNAAVRNSGSDLLGYATDISNAARTSPYDRGAWEYDGIIPPPPPVGTKIILPYINYQGAF